MIFNILKKYSHSQKGILREIYNYLYDKFGSNEYINIYDRVGYENSLGNVFAIHLRSTIPASTTIELAMKIPDNGYQFEFLPAFLVCDKSLNIDFHQDVKIDGYGQNIASVIRCLNQRTPKTTQITEVLTVPNITNYGEVNFVDFIPASKYTAGESQLGASWITKSNVYYALKLQNMEVTSCTYKFSLYWIEKEVG